MKLLLATLALSLPATAQAQDWTKGTPVAVTATATGFTPATLALRSGRQYVLTIRNATARKASFSAPTFFKLARVAPRDSGWVTKNVVELEPGQTARLHIFAPDTPNAVYEFRSTRLSGSAKSMKGEITVR